MNKCDHYWIPNSGYGGEPEFKFYPQMHHEALMHVRCYHCGCRTWFTREQWHEIPAAPHPEDRRG